MSTRSIVAAHTEKGIQGVYVHSDGYPEGRLPVLKALIQRDGVAQVVKAIIGEPNGWSHLDEDAGPEIEHQIYKDGRFIQVEGYGLQYAPAPIQGDEKHWRPEDHTASEVFIEYIYLIEPDGSIKWADSMQRDFNDLDWQIES